MSALGAAAIAGGFELLGGLLGRSGTSAMNRANLKIAREQMAFQERMSSSAYQRSAEDLRKAGLNRILALGSPASTPSGARAQMQNVNEQLSAALGRAGATAYAARRLHQELDNMKAVADNTRADTELKDAQQDVATENIQNLRAVRRTELARYVQLMIGAQNQMVNTALTSQALPGATAEANIWRKLETMNADEFAKATGITAKLAPSVLMAIRMLLGGKK